MKIKPSIDECSNIIVGAYSGSIFYEKFDKVLYENNGKFADVTLNSTQLEKIYDLLTKIQTHWNCQNRKDFTKFIENNIYLTNSLLKNPKVIYKDFIRSINLKGIQNTKISKILHIFKPDFFPMLDPFQGKFLIEKYNKNSREDLICAIEYFHKHYKNNFQKAKKIKEKLINSHRIRITTLRVFELLIWLQTQISIKEINKDIIEKNTI